MITNEAKDTKTSIGLHEEGERTVLSLQGCATGDPGLRLASQLQHLSVIEHPDLTVDLRGCKCVDPIVVHALMHAWEQRNREFGCIRVLVSPGPVARYLDVLGLGHALDVVHDDTGLVLDVLPRSSAEWEPIQEETVEHFHRLLAAARRHDLTELRRESQQAHALCVAVGAHPSGDAFGPWCAHCPMRAQYGGCQPLIDHMLRAGAHNDWKTAQLLILTLVSEAVGMKVEAPS
jgi:hypothetical protein